MKKKIITVVAFVTFMIFSTKIYATGFLQNVFNQASNFATPGNLNSASSTGNTVGGALSNIIGGGAGGLNIVGTIFDVGNLVIFVVTIALGIKYIYSGIDGKADIKSSLPNYVFGIVFFYLANGVYELSRDIMIGALTTSGNNYNTFAGNIYSTVNAIANTCAILGIVLVGLKYMMSPADAKADVKKQLIPVALGIVLVYSTLKVITLIYKIGDGIV